MGVLPKHSLCLGQIPPQLAPVVMETVFWLKNINMLHLIGKLLQPIYERLQ